MTTRILNETELVNVTGGKGGVMQRKPPVPASQLVNDMVGLPAWYWKLRFTGRN